MAKNTKKYLLFLSVIFSGLFLLNNLVLAEGSACGISSEGICKSSCGPFDEIYTGDFNTKSGSICATSPEGVSEQCCIETYCKSNNIGFGTCESKQSCDYGYIGINTTDCAPSKICCVLPKASGMDVGDEIESPILDNSSESSIFTGGNNSSSESSGGIAGLVPCRGTDCSLCDIFVLIKNLINFFTELVFALAGGFIVWGAIEIMVAGGDEKKVTSGRGRITIAIYGVAIALGSWLLVGTVLQILTGSSSYVPWNKIECSSKPLVLPKVSSGSDSACTNKGGNCQDISITPCDSGDTIEPGLCLSSSNANYKCCIPSSTSYTCEKTKNYKCMTTSDGSRFKPVAGSCPSGQNCFDVSTPWEAINPQL